MFAYFEVANKQFIAKKGDILRNCPFIPGNVGDTICSDRILAMDDFVSYPEGKPIEGAYVSLKIVKQGLSRKKRIVHFSPQKRHEK